MSWIGNSVWRSFGSMGSVFQPIFSAFGVIGRAAEQRDIDVEKLVVEEGLPMWAEEFMLTTMPVIAEIQKWLPWIALGLVIIVGVVLFVKIGMPYLAQKGIRDLLKEVI